jgi:hypothetical protein
MHIMIKPRYFVITILTGVFMFNCVQTAFAQTSSDTPESVAASYMAAMRAGDWARCAALMHPDALTQLRRIFTPIVAADESGQVLRQIFNVQNNNEFAQLSDAVLFERVMRAVSARSPETSAGFTNATMTIIGSVPESPDMSHVVYRMEIPVEGVTVTTLSVMSLRRHGATWRALLTGNIEGLGAILNQRRSPPSGRPGPQVRP